jgi:hypothetical protein
MTRVYSEERGYIGGIEAGQCEDGGEGNQGRHGDVNRVEGDQLTPLRAREPSISADQKKDSDNWV